MTLNFIYQTLLVYAGTYFLHNYIRVYHNEERGHMFLLLAVICLAGYIRSFV